LVVRGTAPGWAGALSATTPAAAAVVPSTSVPFGPARPLPGAAGEERGRPQLRG
jgi:hypothetical protein